MALSTTYYPGGTRTATDNYNVGDPSAGLHGIDLSSVARAIMAKKDADAAMRNQQIAALQQPAAPPPQPGGERMASGLDTAREQAELAKLHAMYQPQPMKWTTIGNQQFLQPDDLAMNAAQRQMYLPQSATFSGGGGRGGGGDDGGGGGGGGGGRSGGGDSGFKYTFGGDYGMGVGTNALGGANAFGNASRGYFKG